MDLLEKEYQLALFRAKSHYENFPVISLFLPKKIRKHVAIIYKFARTADDFADEVIFENQNRLYLLDEYQQNFINAINGNYNDVFWQTLVNTISIFNLPPQLFIDLLTAFKQDLIKKEYSNFEELLGYCKNSANPIGRLILRLHGINNEEADNYSDKICTALQLANFWQDISVDIKKDRVYLPISDITKFNYSILELYNSTYNNSFISLMEYQIKNTERMFYEGAKLLKFLPLRLKFQIKLTILGGLTILDKIKKNEYNVVINRPTIDKKDVIYILLKSFIWMK
ncbi:MAG TPA: squalene synthase HpnC [Melioribacteraceae bacterium]|nr:squalene synthase HpnC [Melioribacteraceae bacterium]